MGPANNTVQGFFITNFITFTFLILCLVPFCVQLVTGCDKLHKRHFSKYFTSVFMKIHCVLKTVIGLYQVAHQCRQFYAPMPKSKRNRQGLNQRPIQTAPLTDECITGLQIRLTLVLTKSSPLLAPLMTEESTSKTCMILVPIIVLYLCRTLVSNLNSTELHLQGVVPRSQYSDPMLGAVTLQ